MEYGYGFGMAAMVRMGARVSIAAAPPGYGAPMQRVHDQAGRLVRTEVRGRDLELLDLVQFVDLVDGRRVSTTEQFLLSVALDSNVDELRDRVRELVQMGGDRYKPRWQDLIDALHEEGVSTDEPSLAALPWVFERDDDVGARFGA